MINYTEFKKYIIHNKEVTMDDKQHTSSSNDERTEIATSNQDQQTNSSKRVHLKRWHFISILIGTILITAVITVVAYIL